MSFFLSKKTFARAHLNQKKHQLRHSRVGGNPVDLLIRLNSRLRGKDDDWGFKLNLG